MKSDQVSIVARRNLGLRIRGLRTERKLSQRKFADMVAIDRSYLSGIERGRRNASFEKLMKISSGFGMPLSELVSGVDSFIYEQVDFPER